MFEKKSNDITRFIYTKISHISSFKNNKNKQLEETESVDIPGAIKDEDDSREVENNKANQLEEKEPVQLNTSDSKIGDAP